MMKFSALVALASTIMSANAACDFVAGNYYCNQVEKIVYEGIGFSGSYQDVTNMDENTGACTLQPHSFSGSMSPLDEGLSVHFRGPLKLLQFGVYYPLSASNAKRDADADADEDCTTTRHVHHKHVKRATAVVTQTVIVDANGNPVTVSSTATPTTAAAAVSLAAAAAAAAAAPSPASAAASPAVGSSASSAAAGSSPQSSASSSSSSAPAAAGDWVRASYYTPGSATNCTFLNYYGGSGSGVWSSAFGNSLSYANADNSGGSSSPVALSEVTIATNTEFVVMSGLECGDDSETESCGYYRAGAPAYHGWNGAEKIFVFEFEMPSSSATGFNGDMPAVWMLNAKIPRTLQYGNADCSCWDTGCGELDLFEILSSGSLSLITHLHDKQGGAGGGSSDYFARPTSGSMKAAVVFTDSNIHILQVDDAFGSTLSADTVQAWVDQEGTTVTI